MAALMSASDIELTSSNASEYLIEEALIGNITDDGQHRCPYRIKTIVAGN